MITKQKEKKEQEIKEMVSEILSSTKKTGCESFLRTLIFSKSQIDFSSDEILSLIKINFPEKKKEIMNIISEDLYGCKIESINMSPIRLKLVESKYNKI